MSTKTQLIAEIKQEATNTRKILASVPFDKADWKPHEKSMSIGKLAAHIAENLRWGWYIVESDFVDFANRPFSPTIITSNEGLLQTFEEHYSKAIAALENTTDEELEKIWEQNKALTNKNVEDLSKEEILALVGKDSNIDQTEKELKKDWLWYDFCNRSWLSFTQEAG